jgi:hypothetical protein
MRRILPLLAALPVLTAAPAWAENVPTTDDAIMFWRTFQVTSPGTATAPIPTNDAFFYVIKQWWLTENAGIYAFYGTLQTVTLRGQYRWPIGGGAVKEDGTKTAPWLVLTGQAGYRAAVMGSSPANYAAGYREGPEVAGIAAFPLTPELSAAASFSYAPTFGYSAATVPAALVFYGANLNWKLDPKTTLSGGFLANLLAPYNGTPLIFHNIGPTLAVSRRF